MRVKYINEEEFRPIQIIIDSEREQYILWKLFSKTYNNTEMLNKIADAINEDQKREDYITSKEISGVLDNLTFNVKYPD